MQQSHSLDMVTQRKELEQQKQNNFRHVDYEEFYLMKGCNDVMLYTEYLSKAK